MYITQYLSADVVTLDIFCDSCGGQNKNYTVFRYLHWLVTTQNRLQKVTVTFPIRGHSYMECDKDFGLLNQKVPAEVPRDWWDELRRSRKNPCPFTVIEVIQEDFMDYTAHLQPKYKSKCPFATQPVREIKFCDDQPKCIHYRESYNGVWESSVLVTQRKGKQGRHAALKKAYSGPIPISKEKFNDLQNLKRFCLDASKAFYDNLAHE